MATLLEQLRRTTVRRGHCFFAPALSSRLPPAHRLERPSVHRRGMAARSSSPGCCRRCKCRERLVAGRLGPYRTPLPAGLWRRGKPGQHRRIPTLRRQAMKRSSIRGRSISPSMDRRQTDHPATRRFRPPPEARAARPRTSLRFSFRSRRTPRSTTPPSKMVRSSSAPATPLQTAVRRQMQDLRRKPGRRRPCRSIPARWEIRAPATMGMTDAKEMPER